MRPSNQFFIHRTVHPSNLSLSNLERRTLLMYVQVPQVVTNLIFPYNGRDFAPPVPVLLSIHLRVCQSCSWGGYAFFDLPFLADIPVEALLIIPCIPCQVQLQLRLGLPDPIPTQPGSIPVLFPGYLSLLPLPLTSRSRLIHASLLPSFPDFLPLGIENSCALWKVSLKICQLCSAPLSLRAVSQGVLLTNSLNSWKFAFLQFRPRLPPILTSPISSLVLVTNTSSIASALTLKQGASCKGPEKAGRTKGKNADVPGGNDDIRNISLNMGETEQRPTAGSRLGAQENAGISTLEHGQKPPMTPPGKLISIKIQMLDDTQETFDVPKGREVRQEQLEQVSQHPAEMTNRAIPNYRKGRLPAAVATEVPVLTEFVIHGKNK
ncbi:hypothetical protein QYF61_020631, partial [Mycteria americana]